ncbi:conserved hypothetical protein [Sulfurovum sp. enrichment culture clone C5]|uniref:Uncharacterized protein n=1 Tax=Sulfurovum sp. enrichment culture clone C5 TaxID=497650 RepID=A0A0S4XQL0_9BACT|nr:conserved hypothetical protein [Sulfurovum sp. enrichment culture clone C5]
MNFVDARGLWTFGFSFNFGGGAGIGGTGGVNFVFDGHGNFEIQRITGLGGYMGAGAGLTFDFEYSNADCINQLHGVGYQHGADFSLRPFLPVSPVVEGGTFGGSGYHGYYLGGGVGVGATPFGYGVYGTNTSSAIP